MTAEREAGSKPEAADELVDRLYGELRQIADRYVRHERARSLQATDLVHEAYMRLRDGQPAWTGRTHFLAIAAISMRRLLVERARLRRAAKRGGAPVQVTLDESLLVAPGTTIDVLDLDAALERLATVDAVKARVVERRYFGGMTVEETAESMDISPATVKRHWALARAWLLRELKGTSAS